jgi:hypothetical protein
MPAPTAEVRLERFDRVDPAEVSAAFHEIVNAPENEGLFVDFPTLRERYATLELALAAIERNVQNTQSRLLGGFAAFAVRVNGAVKGVVTAGQETLSVRRRLRSQEVANGPWIAYWLDARRAEGEHRLGEGILRLLASEITSINAEAKGDLVYRGHAFTVVRPDNRPSLRMLGADDNGFGSFAEVGEPRVWQIGDHVQVPRSLVVARRSVEELSTAA